MSLVRNEVALCELLISHHNNLKKYGRIFKAGSSVIFVPIPFCKKSLLIKKMICFLTSDSFLYSRPVFMLPLMRSEVALCELFFKMFYHISSQRLLEEWTYTQGGQFCHICFDFLKKRSTKKENISSLSKPILQKGLGV